MTERRSAGASNRPPSRGSQLDFDYTSQARVITGRLTRAFVNVPVRRARHMRPTQLLLSPTRALTVSPTETSAPVSQLQELGVAPLRAGL